MMNIIIMPHTLKHLELWTGKFRKASTNLCPGRYLARSSNAFCNGQAGASSKAVKTSGTVDACYWVTDWLTCSTQTHCIPFGLDHGNVKFTITLTVQCQGLSNFPGPNPRKMDPQRPAPHHPPTPPLQTLMITLTTLVMGYLIYRSMGFLCVFFPTVAGSAMLTIERILSRIVIVEQA